MQNPPVIYFDGVCNLCSRSVQFILHRDRRKIFRFASLQGEAGKKMLLANHMSPDQYNSFILQEDGRLYTKSTGALRVLKLLGGGWSCLYVFILIPAFLRDLIYRFISANRYTWFGKKEVCWLPKPEWNDRFLV
jgi:predicted DCC family thiol-disulfide oxidoreductase YuxK